MKPKLTILGAGAAGLGAGYYAKKHKIPFKIFEAKKDVGGIAQTYDFNGFKFDTGAHRFHDKHPEVTSLVKGLLKNDLKKISLPTQIFYNGKLIDFPLTPFDLVNKIGLKRFLISAIEMISTKFSAKKSANFEELALNTYGATLSNLFLLNYTKKLWGVSCNNLSTDIAGVRLGGLNLRSFILETILGKKAKVKHIDGDFYYPTYGIGMIPDALAKEIGSENIATDSPITKITHSNNKIKGIETNGLKETEVQRVVNTIPITAFVKSLSPKPPEEIVAALENIKFRSLKIVALFINKESITKSATITFPEKKYIFTRISEPRNRSEKMSPLGKTSLMIEVPCDFEDETWNSPDQKLTITVLKDLIDLEWLNADEIIDSKVFTIKEAYPKLDLRSAEDLNAIRAYLSTFTNLDFIGRNGSYVYSHIHHQIRWAKKLIQNNFSS